MAAHRGRRACALLGSLAAAASVLTGCGHAGRSAAWQSGFRHAADAFAAEPVEALPSLTARACGEVASFEVAAPRSEWVAGCVSGVRAALGSDAAPSIVERLRTDERWLQSPPGPRFIAAARSRQAIIRSFDRAPARAARLARVRPAERDDLAVRRDLVRLGAASPPQIGGVRPGRALPAGTLLRYYREAQHRFGIRWQLLAAINFVESDFDRARTTAKADAQGPMQFEPATWARYGMGGDPNRPRDAILAAANLLAANGGRTDERAALAHYNLSPLYWDAVLHLAHRMTTVRVAFREYYAWRLFVRRSG